MPLSGAIVTFGEAVDIGSSTLFRPIWSDNIAAGASSRAADFEGGGNRFIFRVRANASGEMYAARGKTPDASKANSTDSQSARVHLTASEVVDLPASTGDKVNVANA